MGEKEDIIEETERLIEESFEKVPTNGDELEAIQYHRNKLVIEDILKKGEKSEKKKK